MIVSELQWQKNSRLPRRYASRNDSGEDLVITVEKEIAKN